MLKRSLPQTCRLARLTIFAAFFVAAASSPSAARPPRQDVVNINWHDTGTTVALRVGQQMVVKLPLHGFRDDSWHIKDISPALKLVAGPDELRPAHWTNSKFSFQVFYFQRQSPGTVNLVLEPNYFLKPMVLKVVDR